MSETRTNTNIPQARQGDGIPYPMASTGLPTTAETNLFVAQTYGLVAAQLGVTAIGAAIVNTMPLASQQAMVLPAILCQFILILALSFMRRSSGIGQLAMLTTFAAFEGVILGMLTSLVGPGLMVKAALPAAATLLAMGAYGLLSKRDILQWRVQLMIGLICVVIMSIMNIFLSFGALDWLFCIAGIALFAGLAAYDTRMISEQAKIGFENPDRRMAAMVQGATGLYLDFINLLMFFLRLFGGNSRD